MILLYIKTSIFSSRIIKLVSNELVISIKGNINLSILIFSFNSWISFRNGHIVFLFLSSTFFDFFLLYFILLLLQILLVIIFPSSFSLSIWFNFIFVIIIFQSIFIYDFLYNKSSSASFSFKSSILKWLIIFKSFNWDKSSLNLYLV